MLSQKERRTLAPAVFLRLAENQDVAPPRAVADAPPVSICIPTQRRPEGLALAARSTFGQTGVDMSRLELVVVDNDKVPSAEALAARLGAEAPFPVRYVHVPEPGVANARNAALAAAKGELIAFIDDDEEAAPGWLAALIETQARHDADVVFGPVEARAPASLRAHRRYLTQFFSRVGPDEAGIIDHSYGCGCSLLRRAALPDPVQPFSPERNHVGGEDDRLFGEMKRAGARFAWNPAALVYEDPGAGRFTLDYALARAFAFGQGPTYECATSTPRNWTGVFRWIAIGLMQASVYGAAAAALWLVRAPDRAFMFDRAARGLGKVLFGGPFARRFYGLS